jgi:serine protease Do
MGVGYAIPINKAKEVADELIKEGKIEHGWLGVSIGDIDPEYADHYGTKEGARVGSVNAGGPADEAGIEADDIIVQIGGKAVTDSDQLVDMIGAMKPGTKTQIKILRDKRPLEFTVTVRAMPEEMQTGVPSSAEPAPQPKDIPLGLAVQSISPDLAQKLGWSGADQGVVVAKVAPGSPASEANIAPGDIIRKINGVKIKNVDDFAAQAKKLKGGSQAFLVVERDGVSSLVEVDMPE